MSVVQYEQKFTELSRFAPNLVSTLEQKIKRFIKGLGDEIRGTIALNEPSTFATALREALVMDKNLAKKAQPRREVGSTFEDVCVSTYRLALAPKRLSELAFLS